MNCTQCGAPLPAKSDVCGFCGALNDTDLRTLQASARKGPPTDLTCPRCESPLDSLDLGSAGRFIVERCEKCLGIFFNPGELEHLVEQSQRRLPSIDHQRMATLIEERGRPEPGPVRYLRCPRCGDLMNRRSYGSRSGVIADHCKPHGVWLDGGELGRLVRWVKAGGLHHDQRRKAEEARRRKIEKRARRAAELESASRQPRFGRGRDGGEVLREILDWVSDLID